MRELMTVTVNDKALRQALKSVDAALADMTPLMRRLAETLKTETDFNFEDEGRPAWEPSVAALARSGMTLSKSGLLRRSITTAYDSSSAGVGTNFDYARIHQLGGKAGRNLAVTLPERPYLPVDADGNLQARVEQKLLDQTLAYLTEVTRR
jgi:phage virion morphogenesis protein